MRYRVDCEEQPESGGAVGSWCAARAEKLVQLRVWRQ